MARQHTFFQNLKAITASTLVAFGVFVLAENTAADISRVSHLLGITAEEKHTLGALTTIGLGASHALQAYLLDHQEFLQALCEMLASFCPLLLVIAGTVLLRERFTNRFAGPSKRSDWTFIPHCPSFDA
jgi:hypothetical protein